MQTSRVLSRLINTFFCPFQIVMDAYEKNLEDFVHELKMNGNSINVETTRSILYQLANALRFLHEMNVIHRDLKPENVLIRHNDDNLEVAITDLGVSREITKTEKTNMTYQGTTLWMAPEVLQCKNKYGHPADVFSFGLIAMYIKTGSKPIDRSSSGCAYM